MIKIKSILISEQQRQIKNLCTVIGEKDGNPIYKNRILIRKKPLNLETPFRCFVYEPLGEHKRDIIYEKRLKLQHPNIVITPKYRTEGRGKVICEFVCDKVEEYTQEDYDESGYCGRLSNTGLSIKELWEYGKGKVLYGLHISNLIIYDEPKDLREFYKPCPEWEKEQFTKKCNECSYYFRNEADMCSECRCDGERFYQRGGIECNGTFKGYGEMQNGYL